MKILGPITLVAIGGNDEARQRAGSAELVFWPYSADRNRLADLYRAADISLHAARVDTFTTRGPRGSLLWHASDCDSCSRDL